MDLRNTTSPRTQLLKRERNGLRLEQPSVQNNFFQGHEQNGGKLRTTIARLWFIGLALWALPLSVSTAFAQNNTMFGPNVYVFTTGDSVSSINTTLNTLNANTQFSTNRYAVLFAPGTYTGVEAEVGYYESVAGLGETPTATTISDGYLTSNQTDSNGNLTTNFWRSIENMSINAIPAGDTYLQWGVSQGAAFRRMYVNGSVELTNTAARPAVDLSPIARLPVRFSPARNSSGTRATAQLEVGRATCGIWCFRAFPARRHRVIPLAGAPRIPCLPQRQ